MRRGRLGQSGVMSVGCFANLVCKLGSGPTAKPSFTRRGDCLEMVDAYYLADNSLKLTKALFSISGFVRASLGLSDEAAWTLQQHGMVGLWQSFDPGADLPRLNSYQIVKKWPRGVRGAALNLVKTCLRGMVPLHPAAPGLHNVWRPNRLVEERVCRIPGYMYEEPQAPRWRHPLRTFLWSSRQLHKHCRLQLARAARQMKLRGQRFLRISRDHSSFTKYSGCSGLCVDTSRGLPQDSESRRRIALHFRVM